MSGRGNETEVRKVRRGRFVAGGLGALGVALLPSVRSASAATTSATQDEFPDPLLLGVKNVAGSTTGLSLDDGIGVPALTVRNASGPGIVGSALPLQAGISFGPDFRAGLAGVSSGAGVVGSSVMPASGPFTINNPGPFAGVSGAGYQLGVLGTALMPGQATITGTPATGVAGVGRHVGVIGSALPSTMTVTESLTLPALAPYSVGVFGSALGEKAVGVLANNPSGYALTAIGKVSFPLGAGGSGVISAGEVSVELNDESISADSLVNVTLAGDPGAPGIGLHYARPGDGVLEVVLTAPARRETAFTYFVFHR